MTFIKKHRRTPSLAAGTHNIPPKGLSHPFRLTGFATGEAPRSNHWGPGAALGGSTSCQAPDEGGGGITGSESEIEVQASSLGERFYCS